MDSIDYKKCQNCGSCLELCETRGLDENGRVIPEFPEICSGCGHCGNICPAKSINARPIPLEEMKRRIRKKKKTG